MYKVTVYLLYDDLTWSTICRWYKSEIIDQGYEWEWLTDQVDNYLEKSSINLKLSDWIIKGFTYENSQLEVVK